MATVKTPAERKLEEEAARKKDAADTTKKLVWPISIAVAVLIFWVVLECIFLWRTSFMFFFGLASVLVGCTVLAFRGIEETVMKKSSSNFTLWVVILFAGVIPTVFVLWGAFVLPKQSSVSPPKLRKAVREGQVVVEQENEEVIDGKEVPRFVHTGAWEDVRFPLTARLPASTTPRWGFAGTCPPATRQRIERKTQAEIRPSSEGIIGQYFVVEGSSLRFKPLSPDRLNAMKWDGWKKSTYVYPLPQVPYTGAIGNDTDVVEDVYVQTAETSAQEVMVGFEPQGDVRQWFVDLDKADAATIDLQPGWEHMWIVPIYDPDYFGKLGDEAISPKGVATSQAEFVKWSQAFVSRVIKGTTAANQEERRRLVVEAQAQLTRLPAPFPAVPYGGIYWKDKKGVKALNGNQDFSKTRQVPDGKITLGVNIPVGESLTKPIRVLVGVSWD